MVDATDGCTRPRDFDVQIEPRTLQHIIAIDLRFIKFNTARDETTVAMHHDQRSLVAGLRLRRLRPEHHPETKQHYD
jgi:hypothetical protein